MIEFPPISDAPNFTPPAGQEWILLAPLTWPTWVWISLLAGVILLGITVYYKLRRPSLVLPPAPPLATNELAIMLLEDLRSQATTLPAAEMAARVTEIIRTYLHRQFGILARFRTTQEILAQRRDLTMPPAAPALRHFEDFLLRSDAYNYNRDDAPAPTLVDEAIETIRQSHAQLQSA